MGSASMAFAFDICMAMRRPDKVLKSKVNEVIAKRRKEIVRILDDFSVPQLPISEHKDLDREAKRDSKG